MSEAIPRLCLIGARTAFDRDTAWLQALSRVAAATGQLAPNTGDLRPGTREQGASTRGFDSLPIVLQVRIEMERDDTEALAKHALDAVRTFAPPSLRVVLNAAGVDAGALGYDGTHWPERRIPNVRRTEAERPGSLSASVHSLDALRRAESAGVDFVQFGPIWEPTWKQAAPVGLGALAETVRAASVPVLAVGGISPRRVVACVEAGAHGVSVVSSVFAAQDAGAALRSYAEAFRVRRSHV